MEYSLDDFTITPPKQNYIQKGGVYKGEVISAYERSFSSCSKGIQIAFRADSGEIADIFIVTISKKGKNTKGLTTLKNMMFIHDIFKLVGIDKKTKVFSSTHNTLRAKDVKSFDDLVGKGYYLELEVSKKYLGFKPALNYRIIEAFHPETKQTASEIAQNIKAVKFSIT